MIQLKRVMMIRAEQDKNLEAVGQLGKVKVDITKTANASPLAESSATKKGVLPEVKKKIDINDAKIGTSLAARADALLGKAGKEEEQQPKEKKQVDAKEKDKTGDDTTSVNSAGDTSSAAAAQQVPVKDRISVPNENDGKSIPVVPYVFNLRL